MQGTDKVDVRYGRDNHAGTTRYGVRVTNLTIRLCISNGFWLASHVLYPYEQSTANPNSTTLARTMLC